MTSVQGVVAGLIALAIGTSAAAAFERDAEDWTILKPSPDSQILYVSSGEGDDGTAVPHKPDDPAVCGDPFMPVGPVKAYKTIAAALEVARDGQPDWVLLKRGDVWYECLRKFDGRSATEPFVIAAYGPGGERPLLKVGPQAALNLGTKGFKYLAVVGLHFYAHTRDPKSPEYVSSAGKAGLSCTVGAEYAGHDLLVEDCCFQMAGLSMQSRQGGPFHSVVLRRNLILDCYSAGGHSQGMFSYGTSLVLEENVFDHNGWLIQGYPPGTDKADGRATMFNHNTYFSHCHDVVFRGNMFLRAASMGNKWRADATGDARNIVLDDNLYVEGEIGIGIGGNDPAPFRFSNVTITNNVLLGIGRSQPTGRTLGWYLNIADWDGGLVADNLFLHQTNDLVRNVYGIQVGSNNAKGRYQGEGVHCRNVTIRDNVVHGLTSNNAAIMVTEGHLLSDITIQRNQIQLPGLTTPAAKVSSQSGGVSFEGNTWHTDADAAAWFAVDGEACGFQDWTAGTGETGGVRKRLDYPDSERTVATYMASLGREPTFEAFLAEVRKQSKANWRPEFTTGAVNDWIRQGFGVKRTRAPMSSR